MTGVRAWAALCAGLAALLSGCGGPGTGSSAEVTVFAASSLRAPFTQLGEQFERTHPGTVVRFNFAGSADLVAQLQHGAAGDVLATADQVTMARAVGEGLVTGDPEVFATNSMTIAVPRGNPAGVTRLADLARPEAQVVVCAPAVPCGAATQRVERRAGVTLAPVSEEQSVTDVVGKVAAGEADAGIVYVTEIRSARDRLESVPIPPLENSSTAYPIGVLAAAADSRLAGEFTALVVGSDGRRVLSAAGFGPG